MNEKFLLDSNSFIAPYRQYYAFDLVPTYWEELARHDHFQRLILLDIVKGEINKGQDRLSQWLNEQTNFIIYNHVAGNVLQKYGEIMQYIRNCGFYTEQAFHKWASEDIADAWLVAVAAVNDYTIITSEVSAGSLSYKNPSNNAKIPDVAKEFGVKTNNLFYMMRQLGIII